MTRPSALTAAPIQTIHPSMRRQVIRRVPLGLSSLVLSNDLHQTISKIAIDVFTSCINVGAPMQDALAAVYLTGLENGRAALEGPEGDRK